MVSHKVEHQLGAFGIRGKTKKEVLWPGEEKKWVSTIAEADNDTKGANQGKKDLWWGEYDR